MTTRQIRDLAIRILGIYYLANAIIGVPQILAIFTLSGKEAGYVENKAVFAIASLTPVGMYFVVAYVLIFKAGVIMALLWPKADEETGSICAWEGQHPNSGSSAQNAKWWALLFPTSFYRT